MKIRLTARGEALVKQLNKAAITSTNAKPNLRQFTLIKYDERGKQLSRHKVMVDMNKYFKAA